MNHHPDYTPERRVRALAWLRDKEIATRPDLSDEARITAVIGLLICDDTGRIDRDALTTALVDPYLREIAEHLLAAVQIEDGDV